MGFDPYKRIRRARTTRRGDILFLATFFALTCAAIAWAVLG